MPIARRFKYTAATSGRSSATAVSFSTSEASATAWRTVRPRARAAARRSSVNTFLNDATICAIRVSPGCFAPERVGVGKEVALEIGRLRIEIANRRRILCGRLEIRGATQLGVFVRLCHLTQREALAKRDEPEKNVATCDLVHHVKGRHRAIEAILTGFQFPSAAAEKQSRAKGQRIADDTRRDETFADRGRRTPSGKLDITLRRRVAFERLMDPAEPKIDCGRREHSEDDEEQEEAKEETHHTRVSR